MREVPTVAKVRRWAGLDVHARSVLAVTVDAVTGEMRSRRLPAATSEVVAFCCSTRAQRPRDARAARSPPPSRAWSAATHGRPRHPGNHRPRGVDGR